MRIVVTKEKKKPRGKPFQKGNPGGGRPKDNFYSRLVKGKVREEFYTYLSKYWSMEITEIEEISKNKTLSMSEQMFLRWYANRMQNPSNEDLLVLAKMLGIKLEHMVIDHLSSDGSHSGVTINANEVTMKVAEAKTIVKSLEVLEDDEWSK